MKSHSLLACPDSDCVATFDQFRGVTQTSRKSTGCRVSLIFTMCS